MLARMMMMTMMVVVVIFIFVQRTVGYGDVLS